MRVCVGYDCLYPWTVGGAERWARNLAEALAADGHEVTYVTRLQWDPADPPQIAGVRVVAVAPAEELYGPDGNRRIGQALRFGRGVLGHLLRHGREYDRVHFETSPYFGVLAAGLARRVGGYRLAVDWAEVWSDHYWNVYLGGPKGRIAGAVQRAAIRIRQDAFCFSELHARRLREHGLRGEVTVLRGLADLPVRRPVPQPAEPLVVFAGRHIPEKNAPAVVGAVVEARRRVPGLRAVIFGDGPQLGDVRAAIAAHAAEPFIEAPGFVDDDVVQETLARAACLLLPSVREGYGMIVIEAASLGVPSVLVRAEDNSSTDHIAEGVNGFVVGDLTPSTLAGGVVAAWSGGRALRESTADWYAAHAEELNIATSLRRGVARYEAHASA